MRWFALGFLLLFAAPTVAWSDAVDDAEAKLECDNLVQRGDECLEWVREEDGADVKGDRCPDHKSLSDCSCNRHGHQALRLGDRIKYHGCKAQD